MLSSLDRTIVSTDNTDYTYEVIAEGGDKKKFVCKHRGCGKIFKFKSEVERHITIHSSVRPFRCQYDDCVKSFKRSDALDNHIRCSHTKETLFTCTSPDCGMKFTSHGSFRYHVLKHNKQSSEVTLSPDQEISSEPSKQVKLNTPRETVVFPPESAKKIESKLQPQENLGYEYFATAAPNYASNVQWEAVSESTEGVPETRKMDEADKMRKIEQENKILKQKLIASGKIIKTMQKQMNDLLNNTLFACQSTTEIKPASLTYQRIPENADTPLIDMMNFDQEMTFLVDESAVENQESLMNSFSSSEDIFEFKTMTSLSSKR